MDDEAKRIAEGLTEAQRKLLLAAGGDIDNDYWMIPREKASARVLQQKGVGRFVDTSARPGGVLVYWNTPLGLRVRAHLEATREGE